MKKQILFVMAAFHFWGCNEPFIPTAPFQPRMVIYSVLTTERDSQFVRIYSTYDAPNNNPTANREEIPITDANVSITDGTTSYFLKPIQIPRPDTSRYQSSINAYFAYPFTPQRARSYILNVASREYLPASVSLTVPGRPTMSLHNYSSLDDPVGNNADPSLSILLGAKTKVYLVRLFIYYSSSETGARTEKRMEVPTRINVISFQGPYLEYIYPTMKRRVSQDVANPRGISVQLETVAFPIQSYRWVIPLIKFFSIEVKFHRAVFYLIQFDEPFYKYYSLAHQFQDRYTIRLDDPDFSNIPNGAGLFASLTVDSLSYDLPEFIRGDFPTH